MKSILSLLIILASSMVTASTLWPDGSYVDRGPRKLCLDGSYIGGGGNCRLTPNGSYIRQSGNESPRLTLNGDYISGGSGMKLCPDGNYVSGSRCKLTPNGTYIAVD